MGSEGYHEPKKPLGLIQLAIFWVVWKEINMRVFVELEEGIGRIRERWFQTFSVLVMGQLNYSMEN